MLIALPYVLVIISAFTHAYWNYLLKRSRGGQLFVGLSKIGEVVLCAPIVALAGFGTTLVRSDVLWPLAVVGAALTLTTYVLLALAYERGELSLVYPISRGGVLLFLPLLGYLVFGERVSLAGGGALCLIVGGIIMLPLASLTGGAARDIWRRVNTSGATALALIAAATTAGYTIWDKRAVTALPAFVYFFAYTTLIAIAYGIFIVRRYDTAVIRSEWVTNWRAILQVGALNTIGYVLVLIALRDATSSYVVALRQLSIAFGALLGWRLLGEPFGAPKRLGVVLLLIGCALVALVGCA